MSKKFAELEVNKSFKFAQPAGGKEEGVFKKIEEINKKGKTVNAKNPLKDKFLTVELCIFAQSFFIQIYLTAVSYPVNRRFFSDVPRKTK